MSAEHVAARLEGLAADPSLVDHYVDDAGNCRTSDLVTALEVAQWQLAGLGASGVDMTGVFGILLVSQIEGIERVLAERRQLHGSPGSPPLGPMPNRAELRDDLDEIRRRLDLAETIQRISPAQFRRAGRDSLFAQCPFRWHDDSSPSFHVTPSEQLWYCHGCGFGGDVIEFIRRHMGFQEPGSAITLARSLAGMSRPARVAPAPSSRSRMPVQIR